VEDAAEAQRLHSQGELLDYDVVRLTAVSVFVVWPKADA
jgi:hypothetical protein